MTDSSTPTVPFSPGNVVPARELTTIGNERVAVPDPHALTHLQFRRFAACPICNVLLRTFTQRHDEIARAGVAEVVVFHSSAEAMLPHQGDLPIAAIADPDRQLYDEFGVGRSVRSVLDPRAWTAPLKPQAWAVAIRERRAPAGEGRNVDMFGLPADFLIDSDGRILAAKYGTHANDQWSVDDLLTLAASHRRTPAR